MELFLDDQRLDSAPADQDTVADVLRRVQTEACPPDKVVVGLRCDGEDVPGDAMAETLQQPLTELDRLEIFTSGKGTLVIEAMEQALASLEATDAECQQVAEMLTEGKEVEGIRALGDCLRIWHQIHEAVAKSIQMLELDPDTTMVEGEPLIGLIVRPKEILLQIKQALQAHDHVLLADILQYEFGEVSEQWQQIADVLRQKAQELVE